MVFSDIAGAVMNAGQAVNDVVNSTRESITETVLDESKEAFGRVTDQASDLFRDDLFEMDTFKEIGSGMVGDALNVLKGEGSVGMIADGALDTMGVPDWAGDLVGAAIDFGMMQNHRGAEQLLSGGGGIAEALGADGVSDFLGSASDKLGMFNNVADGMAMSIGLSHITGGASLGGLGGIGDALGGLGGIGDALGGLGGIGDALGGLGGIGDALGGLDGLLGHAGGMSEHLGTAMDLVQSFSGGDLGASAGQLMDLLGNNTDLIASIVDTGVDPEMIDAITGALGQGSDIMGQILAAYGDNAQDMIGMAPEEILAQAGIAADAMGEEAIAAAQMATQMAQSQVEAQTSTAMDLGSALLESDLGQSALGGLAEAATALLGGGGISDAIASLMGGAASTTAGMVDVAHHDAGVAQEIMQLLGQMHLMSGASNLGDMMGAQVRV